MRSEDHTTEDELDRLLNDPDTILSASRVWALADQLAEQSATSGCREA